MTIDVARLRELHQPMYGHTGDPCSWCREWTPCPVAELLDAYEERDRLRAKVQAAIDEYGHAGYCPKAAWKIEGGDCDCAIGALARALEGRE